MADKKPAMLYTRDALGRGSAAGVPESRSFLYRTLRRRRWQ